MNRVASAVAETILNPSYETGNRAIAEILAAVPVEGEAEKAARERRRLESQAIHEAHTDAHLDNLREIYARMNPTFEKHLEEARRRHGLA